MRVKIIIFFSLILGFQPAQACIHVPLTYEGTVTYAAEEIFMYHDGKYAHMIIKPTIQVGGKDVPDTLGWIIPVQSVPVDYKEADAGIFKALYDYIEDRKPRANGLRGGEQGTVYFGEEISKGLIVHAKKFVGRYEIQAIELKSEDQGQELLAWFAANGFKTKNKDISYYLKHHYVYLAIKITGLTNKNEELKPLHIVYKSDELSVPLKFDSLSGTFNVVLYFLTPKIIFDKLNYASYGLDFDGFSDYPDSIQSEGSKLTTLNLPTGIIYKFIGLNINSESNPLKKWAQDPSIKVK